MLCNIVCAFTSHPVYPAILIPEAINPERVISYAMQNRTPTYQYPVILASNLRELLVMPCKIVRSLTSNSGYLVILVHDTKTVRKRWREILSASGSGQAVARQWAFEKPLKLSVSEHSYFEVAGT